MTAVPTWRIRKPVSFMGKWRRDVNQSESVSTPTPLTAFYQGWEPCSGRQHSVLLERRRTIYEFLGWLTVCTATFKHRLRSHLLNTHVSSNSSWLVAVSCWSLFCQAGVIVRRPDIKQVDWMIDRTKVTETEKLNHCMYAHTTACSCRCVLFSSN